MDSADHRLDPTWQDYDMENWTWTFISIADHCFLQSRTRLSSMLWFLDGLPFYRLASTAASRTAFTPCSPRANFAVNWRYILSKDVIFMIKKQDEEWTWAFFSVAHHCFLQSRTRRSPMLRLLDDLPSFCLGSSTASHTATAPSFPLANLAVNWKCKALRYSRVSKLFAVIDLPSWQQLVSIIFR